MRKKKVQRQVAEATKRNRHFANWFDSACGNRNHDPDLADKDDFALECWLKGKNAERSAKAKAELRFRRTYDYIFDVGFSAWVHRGLWDQGRARDAKKPNEHSMLSLASFLGLD